MTRKSKVAHLALFGGTPAFDEPAHVGRPNLGNREEFLRRLNEILDRNWLSNKGPCVDEFEAKLRDHLGVKHCVPMVNGTVALEIAIRALGLTGEVIVPSFTFVATPHALQWQELTPVFCDIDPKTHTIDPEQIQRLITPRTTGIIGVHVWGRPCNVEALQACASRHGLQLLFDAAHAFHCTYGGKMIGNFGRAEVFSFHATKVINSFEGGAVATNDDDLARELRLMKNFGFTGWDSVDYIGTNGKMNEVVAAMGLTSLGSIEDFARHNRRNYKQYTKELSGLQGVRVLTYDDTETRNYQYIIVEIEQAAAGISRDRLMAVLHAERILARRYFFPGCHNMEPYRSYFPHASLLLPNTDELLHKVLCLPTGMAMDESDIAKVCDVIRFVVRHGKEIGDRLNDDQWAHAVVSTGQGVAAESASADVQF